MTFKKLLIASFMLFSTTILAQKPYNVVLKNEQIKIPICDFQIDSIIDNRHHQRGIGMIKKGRKDRSIPTIFENNFNTLKDYFSKNLPVKQGKLTPIFIVVNRFWIWEEIAPISSYGHLELAIEFCKKDSSQKLISLYTFERTIEQIDSDLPNSHEERIRQVFTEALTNFSKVDIENTKGIVKNIASINSQNNLIQLKEIGIYETRTDFVNRTPSKSSEAVKIVPVEGNKNRYFSINSLTNTKSKIYAYSDGKDFYLNASSYAQPVFDQYSKVLEKGRFILVEDYVPQQYNPSATLLTYSFGIAGALAAYALTESEEKGVVIDLKRGYCFVFTYDNMNYVVSEFPDIQKKWNDSASYNFKTKRKFIGLMNAEK
jgi:hypothetical protein